MADPTIAALPEAPTAPAAPAPVTPDTTGQVAVLDPSGRFGHIPVADLANAQAQGFAIAPKSLLDERAKTPLYKVGEGLYNTGETIEAGVHGALRGATAGLSDVIGKKLRDVVEGEQSGTQFASDLERLKAEHPIASTGGELAGMVGGAVAGSAAGRAGKATLGLFGEAGGLAEGLAGRATSGLAARGALGRAASSAIGLGTRSAVETGLYSGINELSEESLGKPELSAEKILAATGSGALGGFVLGGVLGAGGSLVKSGLGAASDFASGIISKNADKIDDLANEQRWRALDPLKKFTEQANARVEGGAAGVGEVLKKYDVVPADIATASREGGVDAIGPKLDEAVSKVGQQLGDLTGASTATIPVSKVRDALDEVIAPMRKVAGREGVVQSLENYKSSLIGKISPDVGEMSTQSAMGSGTAKELGAEIPFPKDVAKTSVNVFDGKVPTADAWRDMWRPPDGYEMQFKKFYAADGALTVQANIVDSATKKSVGEIENTFSRNGDALNVKHDFIHLDKSVQGKGIARALHDSSMETYAKMGVNGVDLHAAMDAGRYANARLGFSWPKDAGAEWQGRLRTFLEQNAIGDAEKLSGAALEGAPAVAKLKIGDRAIGKEFLLQGPNWAGRIGMPEARVSLQDALFQRKGLDQMVYQEAKSLDPHMRVQLLRDFRAKFEGIIVDSFDDAAKAAGNSEAKGQLLTLKRDYQALSLAQDAAEASTSRMQTNRNLSLTDYISGGIGSKVGTTVGGAVLGAPGAFLGGLAGGAAGSAINKFGRARGNAIAAAALDKAGAYARARAAVNKIDESIAGAAKGIVEGPKAAGGKTPYRSLGEAPKSIKAQFDKAKAAVVDMQQNSEAIANKAMTPLRHLPKIGAAAGQIAMRRAAYLIAQIPQPLSQPTLGSSLPSRVSEPDMHAFVDKVNAAQNPEAVLNKFATGRVTTSMVSALKEVSPEMFADLQAKTMDVVIKRQAKGDPLPYDARQRMSILLGIVTDPSQDPKIMQALQANLADQSQQPGAQGGGNGPAKAPKSGHGVPAQTNKLDKLEES